MIVFKNGEAIKRIQGAAPKRMLKEAFERHWRFKTP